MIDEFREKLQTLHEQTTEQFNAIKSFTGVEELKVALQLALIRYMIKQFAPFMVNVESLIGNLDHNETGFVPEQNETYGPEYDILVNWNWDEAFQQLATWEEQLKNQYDSIIQGDNADTINTAIDTYGSGLIRNAINKRGIKVKQRIHFIRKRGAKKNVEKAEDETEAESIGTQSEE